jgi:hypothetical protein
MYPAINPTPESAAQQLRDLGLDLEDVLKAVQAGGTARRTCTINDPKPFPGYLQWATIVRTLRERTAPRSWAARDLLNMPGVVSPDGAVAVIVVPGDAGTGTKHDVRTCRRRGRATRVAVTSNQLTLQYEGFLVADEDATDVGGDVLTWMLLTYSTGNEIRLELSLPDEIVDGRVIHWKRRIPLPSVSFDSLAITIDDDDDGDGPTGAYEVPVEPQ